MNSLAFISNLAGPDGFLICFLVLIFFGAKRLPELARGMGTAVREFNKAKDEFTGQLTSPPVEHSMATPRQELVPGAPQVAPVLAEKMAETTVVAETTRPTGPSTATQLPS